MDGDAGEKRTLRVRVKRLTPTAIMPSMAKPGDAAYDLFADGEYTVPALGWVLVRTGLAIELPRGTEAQIRPRSGLSLKHGITVLNTPGTIDEGYRGEVGVILIGMGLPFEIKRGDRVAQMAIREVPPSEMIEVEELSDTARGTGGFGSTGRR